MLVTGWFIPKVYFPTRPEVEIQSWSNLHPLSLSSSKTLRRALPLLPPIPAQPGGLLNREIQVTRSSRQSSIQKLKNPLDAWRNTPQYVQDFWGEETEHFLTGQDYNTLLNINSVGSLQQLTFQRKKMMNWLQKSWWRYERKCRAIKQLIRRQVKWHLLLATVVTGGAAEHVQMRRRKPLQEGVGGWNPALWNTVDVPLIWASSYTSLISENWEHVCQVGWFHPRACTSYRTVWWVEEQFLSS